MWETQPDRLQVRLTDFLKERFGPKDLGSVRNALNLARSVHDGHHRDDGTPYVAHPLRTACILVEELDVDDIDTVCAALLHDVLEDGEADLRRDFCERVGPEVAEIVETLTKPSREGRTRDAVNALYFPRIRRASEQVQIVKLADRLDNVRDLPNCRSHEKRDRMLEETESFYVPLIASVKDAKLKDVLAQAFEQAIKKAKQSTL